MDVVERGGGAEGIERKPNFRFREAKAMGLACEHIAIFKENRDGKVDIDATIGNVIEEKECGSITRAQRGVKNVGIQNDIWNQVMASENIQGDLCYQIPRTASGADLKSAHGKGRAFCSARGGRKVVAGGYCMVILVDLALRA